jgi:hypothetical protein
MTYTFVVHFAKLYGYYCRTGGKKGQPQLENLGLPDWQLSEELKGSIGSGVPSGDWQLTGIGISLAAFRLSIL